MDNNDENKSDLMTKFSALWEKGTGFFTIKTWLIMLAAFGILVMVYFIANAILGYQIATNNTRLAGELKASQERNAELQKITTESLTALQASKEQQNIETNLRLEAEKVLASSETKSNEKLQDYEKAKRRVVLNDNTDYSTAALCERAKEFGIICRQ